MKSISLRKICGLLIFSLLGSRAFAQIDPTIMICNQVDANVACQLTSCWNYQSSSCSPEVKSKNIDTLDTTLLRLANQTEFSHEIAFQSFVQQTTALSVDEQMSAYGNLVGLNKKGEQPSKQALLEFLGARELSGYAKTAARNLQLQPEHAKIVVDTITSDLLSGAN